MPHSLADIQGAECDPAAKENTPKLAPSASAHRMRHGGLSKVLEIKRNQDKACQAKRLEHNCKKKSVGKIFEVCREPPSIACAT